MLLFVSKDCAECKPVQQFLEGDDINRALYTEAARNNQRPEKVAKQLEKDRERLQMIQQNILVDKALDFLVTQATVSQP